MFSVQEFTAEASAAVAAAHQFNEPPSNGQYALARVEAVYRGTEVGTAFDLTVRLFGADNRVHSEYDCTAVEPDPLSDQPDVTDGGSMVGNVCFDIPAEALPGLASVETFLGDGPTFFGPVG